MPKPRDKISVRGLKVFGHHGVTDEERKRGQYFVVDLDVELDLAPAGATDSLEDTVDYASLVVDVTRIIGGEEHALLEKVASRIAEDVLERPGIAAATVRVIKPDPPIEADLGSVQVEIHRRR